MQINSISFDAQFSSPFPKRKDILVEFGMKLIIDRKMWLRGEGSPNSYLLRKKDDKMCCLGFLGILCGATKKQIAGFGTPKKSEFFDWPQTICSKNMESEIVYRLTSINDGLGTSDSEKEQLLKQKFSEIDIDVEFV